MGKLIDYICNFFAIAAAALLILVTMLIGYVIFARAVGIGSPAWAVQFTEYSLLWITFLGTAWVLAKGRHISIDLVAGRLKPRTRAILDITHSLVGCGVCAVLCWFGFVTVWSMVQRGVTDVQVVDVAKYKILLIIPVGFLLLALQFFRKAVTGIHSVNVSEAAQGDAGSEGSDAVK